MVFIQGISTKTFEGFERKYWGLKGCILTFSRGNEGEKSEKERVAYVQGKYSAKYNSLIRFIIWIFFSKYES